jgi:hypothetical protein
MRFNRAEDGGVHISVEQLWLAVGIFGEGRGGMSMHACGEVVEGCWLELTGLACSAKFGR